MNKLNSYKESLDRYNDNVDSFSKSTKLFENLIWGLDEVCEFTKYAKGTIYNLVSKGEVPYRRGRRRKLIFIPSGGLMRVSCAVRELIGALVITSTR